MIRADPPEVPSLHRSSESLHQIWESDTRIQHGGCGTLEWIINIIAGLSPPHLAKSLKRRSNHNIQSSCCGSSSPRILNARRVDSGLHHNNSGRGLALAAG